VLNAGLRATAKHVLTFRGPSVCLSVGHNREPHKTDEPIEMSFFWVGDSRGPKNVKWGAHYGLAA